MDAPNLTDAELLVLRFETGFVFTDAGRLVESNSPDRLRAPRMYLAGSASGNEVRFRDDVSSALVETIERLVSDEPPLYDVDRPPAHRSDYIRLFGDEVGIVSVNSGLAWSFPQRLSHDSDATLIHSETSEAEDLVERLLRDGMPDAMVSVGYTSVDDFWPPWCIALHDDEIAAITEAARLTAAAAEAGVTTVEHLRRRGYATAATAGWAQSPALRNRTLFYSTDRSNSSSRHVAARLNLGYLGATFTIA